MLVNSEGNVQEVAIGPPKPGEKAWIDFGDDSRTDVENAFRLLGWDAQLANQINLDANRAQMNSDGDLWFISALVPDGETLKMVVFCLGPGVLITVHRGPIQLLADLHNEVGQKTSLLDSAHYLLYEALERVADSFLEQMDAYEEKFDGLEEAILNGQDRAHDVFSLRHQLHGLRGVLADMRRIAARLSRRQFGSGSSQESNIFVDVYDGFYHVMDNIDSLRDNLTGLVDLQLNQRSMRLNEIMKFLTIFSTIFLPLSFVTGFFGMNLHSMPELGVPHGQALTMILMGAVAASMLYVFKRRKWM